MTLHQPLVVNHTQIFCDQMFGESVVWRDGVQPNITKNFSETPTFRASQNLYCIAFKDELRHVALVVHWGGMSELSQIFTQAGLDGDSR